MKNISVGQNLRTLKNEGKIIERSSHEDLNSTVGFAMIKRPNSRNIEGVMYDTVTADVLYVFRRPVPCPQSGLGRDAPDVPLMSVQPKYIYDGFFREDIGDYFFRHHAGNLALLQAVWNDDRKALCEMDLIFYGILKAADNLRRAMRDPMAPPRTKLYQGGVFGSDSDNLRFHHGDKELTCRRTMVIHFHNVDTTENVPPILVEYTFYHPTRPRPGRVSGHPHTLKLSRKYYRGEWPNIKVFMEDPRNKPYLDLFYAENP